MSGSFDLPPRQTWPRSALDQTALPAAAKEFLAESGLPLLHPASGITLIPGDLPPLPGKPWLRQLGASYETPICIDEFNGGRVVYYDESLPAAGFVNSSIQMFSRFLEAHFSLLRSTWNLDSDERLLRLQETKEALTRLEREAFEDPQAFWSLTFGELESGA